MNYYFHDSIAGENNFYNGKLHICRWHVSTANTFLGAILASAVDTSAFPGKLGLANDPFNSFIIAIMHVRKLQFLQYRSENISI